MSQDVHNVLNVQMTWRYIYDIFMIWQHGKEKPKNTLQNKVIFLDVEVIYLITCKKSKKQYEECCKVKLLGFAHVLIFTIVVTESFVQGSSITQVPFHRRFMLDGPYGINDRVVALEWK